MLLNKVINNDISYLYKVNPSKLNNYSGDHFIGITSFDINHLLKHGVKKKDIVTFAILNLLPSKRSEYYKVVDDIKKITQIEIYTMSLDFLDKMIKQNETINDYNYKDFYISSIEDNKFFKPSK